MACPTCGAETPPGARFCPSCGHALVSRQDERRVATVLFADLVGFTRLSESADPEQVKNIVDRCFERLAAEIVSYGGQVDKVIGDALVAIFGAPVAHEDDAERAVRAGLRMQERLEQLNRDAGTDLRMRVGINTGEVLVGAIRAGGDYTAMGDVVNTASRLQSIAQPGEVVVGPTTYAATARAVSYEPLGSLSVKGREESVQAWHAITAIAPPGFRSARPETPLVGRDDELVVLRASLTTAVTRRRTHFIMLAGEAGVGKTRLAEEIGREAEDQHDARVLTGHCIPYGESDAWYPIGAMVASALCVDLRDDVEVQSAAALRTVTEVLGSRAVAPELARIAEGLLTLMGKDPRSDVDPGRAHEDALRAGLTFLHGLAEERPLVLILSDLHWADPELLEFLPRLLQRLSGTPSLLLATARAEFADEWSPPPGRHNAVHVHLDPLSEEDTDALLGHLVPDVSPEVRTALRERSGGNPFFVEELAMMAADSGGHATTELPATLHGLVAARLDRLPPTEHTVLEDAAVIGMKGPITLVETLAATRHVDARTALAELAREGLLDVCDDEYSFRNELTREIAYGTLTKAERARRHATLAKAIAQDGERTGRLEEVMDRLGYHFNLAASLLTELDTGEGGIPAGMAREAVQFLSRAARRAEQREDWKSAEKYLDHAIPLVDHGDPAARLDLHLLRARSRAEQRKTPSARHDLAIVDRLARELEDPAALAGAATILGDVQQKEGDTVTASDTFDRAIAMWRELDDPAGLAEALRFSGMNALFRGQMDKAAEQMEEALTRFRSVADLRGEAWALQNLAWTAFVQGDYLAAESRLETSAARFGEIGDWGGVAWALGLLAWVRFVQGRIDEARDLAEQMETEAGELGNRWAVAMMRVLLANIGVWQGRLTEALERSEAAISVLRELGDPWGELQAMSPLIIAHTMLGSYRRAQALIDEVETVGFQVVDASMNRLPGLVRTAIAVMTGDERADALAKKLLADVDEPMFINDEQRGILGLARLQQGDIAGGLDILERARDLAFGAGSDVAMEISCALARVGAGRSDDAALLLADAEPRIVTFVDRYRFDLARAFVRHAQGATVDADAALHAAMTVVDATESVLDRAIVRLAASAIWGDSVRAETAAADAFDLLEGTGINATGWERLFAALTH